MRFVRIYPHSTTFTVTCDIETCKNADLRVCWDMNMKNELQHIYKSEYTLKYQN